MTTHGVTPLGRAIERMVGDEPTLLDIKSVLYLIGKDDAADLARPKALNDLVRDAMAECRNPACSLDVAPWDDAHDGCCGPSCRNEWLRTMGETA